MQLAVLLTPTAVLQTHCKEHITQLAVLLMMTLILLTTVLVLQMTALILIMTMLLLSTPMVIFCPDCRDVSPNKLLLIFKKGVSLCTSRIFVITD